jgi:hypothetical protein
MLSKERMPRWGPLHLIVVASPRSRGTAVRSDTIPLRCYSVVCCDMAVVLFGTERSEVQILSPDQKHRKFTAADGRPHSFNGSISGNSVCGQKSINAHRNRNEGARIPPFSKENVLIFTKKPRQILYQRARFAFLSCCLDSLSCRIPLAVVICR